MLRRFARDYPTRVGRSARAIAQQIGVSRGGYNAFVHGKTRTQDRVRRPVAELYLSVPPELRGESAEAPPPKERRRVAERASAPYADTLEAQLRRALGDEPELRAVLLRDGFGRFRGERTRAAKMMRGVEAALLELVERWRKEGS